MRVRAGCIGAEPVKADRVARLLRERCSVSWVDSGCRFLRRAWAAFHTPAFHGFRAAAYGVASPVATHLRPVGAWNGARRGTARSAGRIGRPFHGLGVLSRLSSGCAAGNHRRARFTGLVYGPRPPRRCSGGKPSRSSTSAQVANLRVESRLRSLPSVVFMPV